MPRPQVNDFDYLAAQLHGRRSRLAEAERLNALCSLPNLSELTRAHYPEAEFHAASDFQRRLAQELVSEMTGFLKHLEGPGAALLEWILVRFQVENIKVLLRGFMRRTPLEAPQEYLLSLPRELSLNAQALMAANSFAEFTELLPLGAPRKSLREALEIYRDHLRPFFLEAALDHGYFEELLERAGRLSGDDRELVRPIVLQEVNAFHLMLAVRGKFNYGISPELLLPLRVRNSGIPGDQFAAILAAPDVFAAASVAVGKAIDTLPGGRGSGEKSAVDDAAALEALAWSRFLRLSNRAFRCGNMGRGEVVGYVGIRRVELANLITLSEGIGWRMTTEALRVRLLPRTDLESVYA